MIDKRSFPENVSSIAKYECVKPEEFFVVTTRNSDSRLFQHIQLLKQTAKFQSSIKKFCFNACEGDGHGFTGIHLKHKIHIFNFLFEIKSGTTSGVFNYWPSLSAA